MTDGEIFSLLIRVEAGTLTAPERRELAKLLRLTVAATCATEDHPAQARDNEWAAGMWTLVGPQMTVLLETARGQVPAPAEQVRPGFDDPHRMFGGLLVAVGIVLVVALIFLAVSGGWLW